VTRAQYLFPLAHLCHVSPPVVDGLAVRDFAQLLAGINEYRQAQAKAGAS
jgi:hypothetical protein